MCWAGQSHFWHFTSSMVYEDGGVSRSATETRVGYDMTYYRIECVDR